MCERYIVQLPLAHPQLRTWPSTQACALTGNRTCNLSVCRPALSPLSHTVQGPTALLSADPMVRPHGGHPLNSCGWVGRTKLFRSLASRLPLSLVCSFGCITQRLSCLYPMVVWMLVKVMAVTPPTRTICMVVKTECGSET